MNEIKTRIIINRNFIKTKLKLKIIKTKNQKLEIYISKSLEKTLKNKGKCNHIYTIQIGCVYKSIISVATSLVV